MWKLSEKNFATDEKIPKRSEYFIIVDSNSTRNSYEFIEIRCCSSNVTCNYSLEFIAKNACWKQITVIQWIFQSQTKTSVTQSNWNKSTADCVWKNCSHKRPTLANGFMTQTLNNLLSFLSYSFKVTFCIVHMNFASLQLLWVNFTKH